MLRRKKAGKEKRAPNPLRDLDGNQDRSNNYLSRSFPKRTPSLGQKFSTPFRVV